MNRDSYQKAVKTEKYHREFIEQNSEAIYRIDLGEPVKVDGNIDEQCEFFFRDGFIAEFNKSFTLNFKTLSDRELTNLPLSDLPEEFEPLSKTNIRKFLESDLSLAGFETQQTGENGQIKFFLNDLLGVVKGDELVCVWGQQRDITALKSVQQDLIDFEKNLRRTQKIEALGRLAGGIAHDFNNFLAVMVLHNDMLNLQLPANSPIRHRTEEMRKATDKATAMVKQLLAIGRKQTLRPHPMELNDAVNEFLEILPSIIPENIKVEINLTPNLGLCFLDPGHFIQGITKLVINAVEAMPDGGVLSIETANVVLDKNSINHKSQPEGSFVQITISDTGIGMAPATLESAFEPFFSTKKSTKGVGLGLATVYGFIKQSKGFIWVESEINQGTTFKIQFPRIDQLKNKDDMNFIQ